jgi:hypothetical protein
VKKFISWSLGGSRSEPGVGGVGGSITEVDIVRAIPRGRDRSPLSRRTRVMFTELTIIVPAALAEKEFPSTC